MPEIGNHEIATHQPLTPESLQRLEHLEFSVQGNFSQSLEQMNKDLGITLLPRLSGFHMTVIGPTESGVFKTITQEQLDELQRINDSIQKNEGVKLAGVGYIDGATREGIKDADKMKKVAYVAVDAPEVNAFRKKLGLRPKDLHITMGFVENDIHMQIVGKNEKGKDILKPIEKKANPEFSKYLPSDIKFGELTGPQKPTK